MKIDYTGAFYGFCTLLAFVCSLIFMDRCWTARLADDEAIRQGRHERWLECRDYCPEDSSIEVDDNACKCLTPPQVLITP